MDKLTKLMVDLVDETKEKVKNEIEINEAKYKIKLTKINLDLDSLKEDLALKNEELNKTKKEFKSLEDELNRIKKGNICIDDSNTSKLLILEKNLESTFQKLVREVVGFGKMYIINLKPSKNVIRMFSVIIRKNKPAIVSRT